MWRGRRARAALCLASAVAGLGFAPAAVDPAATLPFAPGEALEYRIRSSRFGTLGFGVMRILEPEVVRGVTTWPLAFDFRARLGIAIAEDHPRSWLSPRTVSTLRYVKHERTPLGRRTEEVEVYPGERRYVAAGRPSQRMETDLPLDELSFLYFIRTLPLTEGAEYTVSRHFDTGRNPVKLRVIGRGRIVVPAGEFSTIEVLMEVKDPQRVKAGKRGVILINLSDDRHRVPVRIESNAPWIGAVVLSLQKRSTVSE